VFWILVGLCDQPRHCYALIRDVEALSSGRLRLTTGTLYGALRRLLEQRWIERVKLADTSRDKQAYRLTTAGRVQLKGELRRLSHAARTASMQLKTRGA
jgi:DNA-binding PadR family transcriptional regulator